MSAPVRVLLIEDNPGDARLIREMLKLAGDGAFALTTVGTLRDGLRQLADHGTDLILLDLSLPDSLGPETLNTVRTHAPDLPIVVLTGFDDTLLGIKSVKAGAQDYLSKDAIDTDTLIRAIRYGIERHRIELAERTHRALAEALREVLTLLTSTLDLEEVLERILENLGRVVRHDAASVMLLVDDHLHVAGYHRGARQAPIAIPQMEFTPETFPTLHGILVNKETLIVPDVQAVSYPDLMLMQPETVVYAGTPICLQEEAIGLLSVFCFAPDTFSAEDGDRLAVFAEQAAIAIHNARLYQQSQELAVMQERQRLARDLHDSISQTLFTASVTAESAVRQWESNPHKAKNLVAQLHQLTSNALTDMRMLLLELRPASLAQTAFPQLLEQLCQSLQSRRQVECELAIDDLPPLPENLKVGLYRVVQEAMNNITKHSHATHVHVSARLFSDELVVQVRDNGRGFLPDQVSPGSMGLGIMRERMDLLGASLNVESQVGQGTQVTVRALL